LFLLNAILVMGCSVYAQVEVFDVPAGFANVVGPFVPLASLKTVPNPVLLRNPTNGDYQLRPDLTNYVVDLTSAIRLGKSFFWDMQTGSDNRTACASCHFHAGVDSRSKGQINKGANKNFEDEFPNQKKLNSTNFPFHSGSIDRDDVVGSQGVLPTQFDRVRHSKPDAVKPTWVRNVIKAEEQERQVTGRNTPSIINAVFNHRNFWDGRAQNEFNGISPFGNRDLNAIVWEADTQGSIFRLKISITNASLASQAVGPILNGVEMSAEGRSFPHLAVKLLDLHPLASQQISTTDSVLGSLVLPSGGLSLTYRQLIQKAFQTRWWDSRVPLIQGNITNQLIEANFSLFWGISIMLYEATLVSDDSPLDRYFDSSRNDLGPLENFTSRMQTQFPGLTVSNILRGLAMFEQDLPPLGVGLGCILCHAGPETTSASVRHLTGVALGTIGVEGGDLAAIRAGFDLRLERMFNTHPPIPVGVDSLLYNPTNYTFFAARSNGVSIIPPLPIGVRVYDTGWYNIGVRPTLEDIGIGGRDPFGNQLSWTKLFQGYPDPSVIKVLGAALPVIGQGSIIFTNQILNAQGFPVLSGPLLAQEATGVDGGFKVPSLRNSELTGPYFHNGGLSTLRQVVSFYRRGGDFANPTLAPLIRPIPIDADQADDLVAFMASLTDERVRWQKAPFDHPQILLPLGSGESAEYIEIEAVGANGSSAPLESFLQISPFEL
jgi:cytochrome c peroxidase